MRIAKRDNPSDERNPDIDIRQLLRASFTEEQRVPEGFDHRVGRHQEEEVSKQKSRLADFLSFDVHE